MIDHYIKLANKWRAHTNVILVTNVDGITTDFNDYSACSVTSEFLSEMELEQLMQGFRTLGFSPRIYYDELHFIKAVLNGDCLESNRHNIVINMAQKGDKIGRKSLIPSFCDLNNIAYVNSNPYVVSLCRNKYHSGNILTHHGFPVPDSWLYVKGKGWLNGKHPPDNYKVIVKLNAESASIGLDHNNIIVFTSENQYLIERMSIYYNQDIVIQSFIEGYEAEVPFISGDTSTVLTPVGIQLKNQPFLGDEILSYNIRGTDAYHFYNFSELHPEQSENIVRTTEQISATLGIRGFGRIDYRINRQGQYYVTDIATNPHIVKHSSFHYAFTILGYTHAQMLGTLIGVALFNDGRAS